MMMPTNAEDKLNRIKDALNDKTLSEIDSLYKAADIVFEDDTEHENIGIIFQHTTHRKDEWGTSRSTTATRHKNADVALVVSSWTERDDTTRHSYLLPVDEAERLGHALCCIDDDTFDGLAGRAKEMS